MSHSLLGTHIVSQGRLHAKYQAGHLEGEGPATHKVLESGSELTDSFQRNNAADSWPGSLAPSPHLGPQSLRCSAHLGLSMQGLGTALALGLKG